MKFEICSIKGKFLQTSSLITLYRITLFKSNEKIISINQVFRLNFNILVQKIGNIYEGIF